MTAISWSDLDTPPARDWHKPTNPRILRAQTGSCYILGYNIASSQEISLEYKLIMAAAKTSLPFGYTRGGGMHKSSPTPRRDTLILKCMIFFEFSDFCINWLFRLNTDVVNALRIEYTDFVNYTNWKNQELNFLVIIVFTKWHATLCLFVKTILCNVSS